MATIDNPTPLELGHTLHNMCLGGGAPGGLFTPRVLGTPEQVHEGLNGSVVLQHELVRIVDGLQKKPRMHRDDYNRQYPSTCLMLCQNGRRFIGGGMECGMIPLGAAAANVVGLRPGVQDARGQDWNQGPVRGLTTASPEAHLASGVPHGYVNVNWMMKKKGGASDVKMAHLTEYLVDVGTQLGEGRDVHCHCIPLLFPPGGLLLLLALLVITSPRFFLGGVKKTRGGRLKFHKRTGRP